MYNILLLGQNQYQNIDRHAIKAPKSVSTDISKLHTYLQQNTSSDKEKLRSVFIWIVSHISYDKAESNLKHPPKKEINDILSSKKAICTGYADLLKTLCQISEIPAYVISGYSRPNGTSSDMKSQSDHAWNAVYLDSSWYLVDATWAASGYRQASNKEISSAVGAYYLMDPTLALQTHIPAQPWWQLVNCPVPMVILSGSPKMINDYIRDTTCTYSFRDTIQYLMSLSQNDLKLYEHKAAYEFYPTVANAQHYSSTIMDIVGSESEELIQWQSSDKIDSLIYRQDYLLTLCRSAANISTLYPYQKELFIENMINHLVALYNQSKGKPNKSLKTKLSGLIKEVEILLLNTPESYYTRHAEELCKEYKLVLGF